LELFSDFFVHPDEKLHTKLKKYFRAKRSSFSLAVYLSLILHSAIFAIFCFSALSSSISTSNRSNQRAIFQAIKEDTSLTDSQGNGMTDLLKGFDISGYNLSEDEKRQLYKKLIASYAQLKDSEMKDEDPREITREDLLNFLHQKGGFNLESGKKVLPSISTRGKQKTKLNVLPKPTIKDLQSLQKFPSRDLDYYVSRGNVWVRSPAGTKIVPSQYFFRESPYEQILAQGIHLFYVVDGFPVLEEKAPSGVHYVDTASESLFQEKAERGFQVILLSGLSGSSGQIFSKVQEDREKLEISPTFEEHFNQFCDEFLALPEEQQFLYFRTKYLEKYDMESEELAYLTRKFIHRNLNNIIIPVSEISTAFDYLEELYFNKPLEHQFLKLWQDYPDTSVGAQVLLTLASHYDFERRAIRYLYEAYDEARSYLTRKYKVSEVYNKKTKCYVIKKIYEQLGKEIKKRGYASVDEVSQKYIEKQIELYGMVIDMEGEPGNHGLYDLGCLYWDLNLYDLAIDTWAKIDNSYESKALDSIREALTWLDDTQNAHTLIDNILNWYATKGVSQRLKRLIDLGKWKARGNAVR
jgi:hypothetical protein